MLAALSGINSCSGPGMLDFESCQSLEKLVLDNEIVAAIKRVTRGIELREGELPAQPHFEELLRDGHLLISDHTRRWIDEEVRHPDPVINRANLSRYLDGGAKPLELRASERVEEILSEPARELDAERAGKLEAIMLAAAEAVGMEALPPRDV
jgi:trimethylamine--corrinoid protein Co-methyltransferase